MSLLGDPVNGPRPRRREVLVYDIARVLEKVSQRDALGWLTHYSYEVERSREPATAHASL